MHHVESLLNKALADNAHLFGSLLAPVARYFSSPQTTPVTNQHAPVLLDLQQNGEANACAKTIKKFAQYLQLLTTWNQAFNLTAIIDPREMVYLHIIDSLSILPFLHGDHLLDVGSGAGLPGLPLAIVQPEKQWVLLDKNSKKTRFLTQAVAELSLKNVTVINERAEHFHPVKQFDSIVSRAYSTLREFAQSTEHLLNPHGIVIAMKGKYPENELAELPAHFHVQRMTKLHLCGIEVERHVVCFNKDMR